MVIFRALNGTYVVTAAQFVALNGPCFVTNEDISKGSCLGFFFKKE